MSDDISTTTKTPAKGPDRVGQGIGAVFGVLVGVYVAQLAVAENGNSWFGGAFLGVLLGFAVGVIAWKFVGALRSFLSGDFMDDVERINRTHRDAQKALMETAKVRRAEAAAARAAAAAPAVPVRPMAPGKPPAGIDEPRGGKGDDLKAIKGVGPKLAAMLNAMGYWHYDQIAAWGDAELAWMDANLEGFKGRASRDGWVAQARALAAGDAPEGDAAS